MQTSVQWRPFCIFLLQCQFLRHHSNSKSTGIINQKACLTQMYFVLQFFNHYMMYENEIGLYYYNPKRRTSRTSSIDPEYRYEVTIFTLMKFEPNNFVLIGNSFPATTWSMRHRQLASAINQEVAISHHRLAQGTWLLQ